MLGEAFFEAMDFRPQRSRIDPGSDRGTFTGIEARNYENKARGVALP